MGKRKPNNRVNLTFNSAPLHCKQVTLDVRSFVIEPSEDCVGLLRVSFFEGVMPYKSACKIIEELFCRWVEVWIDKENPLFAAVIVPDEYVGQVLLALHRQVLMKMPSRRFLRRRPICSLPSKQ